MTAAQRAARAKERLAAYKARAPERLKAAEERRARRAAKRAKPPRVKITTALSDKEWSKRKARRKAGLASRRGNRR